MVVTLIKQENLIQQNVAISKPHAREDLVMHNPRVSAWGRATRHITTW